MVVVGWVLSALLALVNLGSGAMKLASSKDKILENPQMVWARDFSPQAIKGIGAVEVIGALGLVLPWLTGIARVLTPPGRGGARPRPGRRAGGPRPPR